MTRILCTADHHFATGPRFEECLAVHGWLVDLVAELKPDLVVSAGDIYDRASNPTEREAVAEFWQDAAKTCPVALCKGNHDRPLDIELLSRLRSKHPIVVTERTHVQELGGVALALCSWPEPAWLAANTGATGEALDQQAREMLRDLLRGLGEQLSALRLPKLAVGHFMVDGSVASSGQTLLGMPLNVSLSDLALLGADAVIAGHIHAAQGWSVDGKPVLYPGSPFRCNFGETEPKSVVLIEWRNGRFEVERIQTPAREMVHVEATWTSDGFEGLYPISAEHAGAEIRFRYRVAADQRETAGRAASEWRDELIAMGAHSVKLEQVTDVQTRERAPEVSRAPTLEEQLQEYWKATGYEPGNRHAPLLSKLNDLEVSNAS